MSKNWTVSYKLSAVTLSEHLLTDTAWDYATPDEVRDMYKDQYPWRRIVSIEARKAALQQPEHGRY